MRTISQRSLLSPLSILVWVFAVAVGVNYFWEIGQGFLFEGMNSWENIWWHCFVASLGDGIILWIIYAAGWVVFRRPDWFFDPQVKGYILMLIIGLIIAVVVEWVAVHMLQRWSYAKAMPVIPVLNIGITPILQMLLLPPIIFYVVAARFKASRTSNGQQW